jgi:hypothetical protein
VEILGLGLPEYFWFAANESAPAGLNAVGLNGPSTCACPGVPQGPARPPFIF